MRPVMLVTKELERTTPRLRETENQEDPLVMFKLFTPWTDWTWLVIEYDPTEELIYGFAGQANDPFCPELGYTSLVELREIKGPFGLRIERDRPFKPAPLSEVQRREFPAKFPAKPNGEPSHA